MTARRLTYLLLASALSIPLLSSCYDPTRTTKASGYTTTTYGFSYSDQQGSAESSNKNSPAEPHHVETLWTHLTDSFELPATSNARIDQEIKWLEAHPHYLKQIIARGEPYLYHIMSEFKQAGLPGELALLPAVESGFRAFAYSPGKAAGLWQFIPSTGASYDLKQNWWYDGRRDVIASTRAAMAHLKNLNKRFDGDWLHTLAAYNAGASRVKRAIARNKSKGRDTDFWSLKLPKETEGYVPRLLAIAKVVQDPQSHGLKMPSELPYAPFFDTVATDGQIDLNVAADLAGIDITELRTLNPGFNRWATEPDGPNRLLLPVGSVDQFEAQLAKLPQDARMRWVRHRIKPGDTLSQIAETYNTGIEQLRVTNHLRGDSIRAGKYLLVPQVPEGGLGIDALAQNMIKKSAPFDKIYQVQRGDSLWGIAHQHHTSIARLSEWNNLKKNAVLQPGMELVIRGNSSGTRKEKQIRSLTRSTIHYKVRKGDSLYLISRKFNVAIADLERWNKLSKKKYLKPGQTLMVKIDATQQDASL